MMKAFTSSTSATTTTATATVPMASPFELLSVPVFKKGHASRNSRNSLDLTIHGVIPGFKTSHAFLSSLGANLRITDDDLLPSPRPTPALRPTYDINQSLPLPSPLPGCILADEDAEECNDASVDGDSQSSVGSASLTTEIASTDDDMLAALKLVADSVAEQRDIAVRLLVFHPLSIGGFALLLCALTHFMFKPELYARFTLSAVGLVLLAVAFIRSVTIGYAFAAQDFDKMWLVDDQILISKFGGVVIGALVLGWQRGEGRGNKRKKWGRGVVRAWTVKQKYRGKGVGAELLQDALNLTAKRGGHEVIFADDHANSKQFLPNCFHAPFLRKADQYRKQLEDMSSISRLGKGRK